jgi:hypothetical protein
MTRPLFHAFCCVAAFATPLSSVAQTQGNAPLPQAPMVAIPTYVAVTRLVLDSPLIVDATVRSATRIKGPEAADVAQGKIRYFIESDVGALIRGDSALAARIGFVADVPTDWRGRAPKLVKQRLLLFARPVSGQAGMVQLTGPDSQQPWSPELDARVRGIVQEILAKNAPPRITGLGHSFHVPGVLPGEGETQIFLSTDTGAPVSLQILRRPGEQPRWAVALGEIIDDAAGPPKRDTLLWYRLACGLPATIPDRSLSAETPENAAAARQDYALVREALGPCK